MLVRFKTVIKGVNRFQEEGFSPYKVEAALPPPTYLKRPTGSRVLVQAKSVKAFLIELGSSQHYSLLEARVDLSHGPLHGLTLT